MHDIVIRGGTIIDGTGRAAFTGDVAIAGERIAGVGGKQGPARREIDNGLRAGETTASSTAMGRDPGQCFVSNVNAAKISRAGVRSLFRVMLIFS